MPNFRHIMCLSIRRYYKIKHLIYNYSIEKEKAIFYIDSLK